MKNFDVNNVVRAFLDGQFEDRASLVTELSSAVRQPSAVMKHLIVQVTEECLKTPNCTPFNTIQIGIMYGMVIGVLLERDRLAQKRKVV
jgi:hypothetical protein